MYQVFNAETDHPSEQEIPAEYAQKIYLSAR